MQTWIRSLGDVIAVRILTNIAENNFQQSENPQDLTPEIKEALKEGFGLEPSEEFVSDSDMARETLSLLAHDPDFHRIITAMDKNQPPERLAQEPATVYELYAALVVFLNTQMEFSRGKSGKYGFQMKPDAFDKKLLKGFAGKLLNWAPPENE
jgi:hypothetical protein